MTDPREQHAYIKVRKVLNKSHIPEELPPPPGVQKTLCKYKTPEVANGWRVGNAYMGTYLLYHFHNQQQCCVVRVWHTQEKLGRPGQFCDDYISAKIEQPGNACLSVHAINSNQHFTPSQPDSIKV